MSPKYILMMMMKSTNQLMSESYLSFKNNINVGDALTNKLQMEKFKFYPIWCN